MKAKLLLILIANTLLAGACRFALADDAPKASSVEPVVVLAASYSFGGDFADVTDRVKTLVRGGETFQANPDSLLVDPHPGWNKCLVVFCEIQGKRAIFSTGEGEPVSRDLLLEKARPLADSAPAGAAVAPPPVAPVVSERWTTEGHEWSFVNPTGSCAVERANKLVTLTVPGALHNQFSGGGQEKDAPTCLTPIEGDFVLQTKVSGGFDPGTETAGGFSRATHSAGLLVYQDKDNYVRLERGESVAGDSHEHLFWHPLLQQNLGGKYEEYIGPLATYSPVFAEEATDLRLVRQGDHMQASVSRDGGKTWKQIANFESLKGKTLQAGVCAVNTAKAPLKAVFDGLILKPGTDG